MTVQMALVILELSKNSFLKGYSLALLNRKRKAVPFPTECHRQIKLVRCKMTDI